MSANQLETVTPQIINFLYQKLAEARQKIIEVCCTDATEGEVRDLLLKHAEEMEQFVAVPSAGGRTFPELMRAVGAWDWYDPTKRVIVDVQPVQRVDDLIVGQPWHRDGV